MNLPGTLDLGAFSLLGREETSEQNLGDGRIRREFVLSVAAYEPGEVQLPAIDVTYLGPARRGEHGAHGAAAHQDREPDRQRARAGAQGRRDARVVMEENRMPLYVGGALLAAASAR